MTQTSIQFTRINNDVNGNPRFVCHFLNIADTYEKALAKAKRIGGKRYHTKTYGGGIVFQCYDGSNLQQLDRQISEGLF